MFLTKDSMLYIEQSGHSILYIEQSGHFVGC